MSERLYRYAAAPSSTLPPVDPVKALKLQYAMRALRRRAEIIEGEATRTDRCVRCGKRGQTCCAQFTYDDGQHLYPACRGCCWTMNHDPRPPGQFGPNGEAH